MQVPYLQMSSVHGKIGLQQQRPPMQIKQPSADLTIKQEHVDHFKISKRPAKLTIDQTEAFADANLKGPLRSSNEFIAKTKQKVAQYISKTVQQGDQLQKIENGGGSAKLAHISKANAEIFTQRSFGYGTMPRNAFQVKFHYQPSEISLNITSSMPDIQVRKNDPNISIPKWQTNAYVEQKNNLTIQAVGLQVNMGL